MNIPPLMYDYIDFVGRTTMSAVKTPLSYVNRIVVRPLVINVEIGIFKAGTRLSDIAHHCAKELCKAYLATPHTSDFHLKLRLRDEDILWLYPVSAEDRHRVERKLRRAIHKKVGSYLHCINSHIGKGHIEMTFAPATTVDIV